MQKEMGVVSSNSLYDLRNVRQQNGLSKNLFRKDQSAGTTFMQNSKDQGGLPLPRNSSATHGDSSLIGPFSPANHFSTGGTQKHDQKQPVMWTKQRSLVHNGVTKKEIMFSVQSESELGTSHKFYKQKESNIVGNPKIVNTHLLYQPSKVSLPPRPTTAVTNEKQLRARAETAGRLASNSILQQNARTRSSNRLFKYADTANPER